MSDVVDLDALEAEATGEPFKFRLAGEEFTLPPLTGLDRKTFKVLVKAFQGEDVDGGLAPLFGDQWERFDALPMSIAQLNRLLEAYLKQQGLALGESSASTSS